MCTKLPFGRCIAVQATSSKNAALLVTRRSFRGSVCWRNAIAATPKSHSAKINEPSSDTLARAKYIQTEQAFLRWVRRLIPAAFALYGLFLLRPTEGHFLRYVAERRHLEMGFNSLFPPLMLPSQPPTLRSSSTTPRQTSWWRRTPKDVPNTEVDEDAARVARRRLLFSRERTYSDDLSVQERIRSSADREQELLDLHEHPPMHLLRDQLDQIRADSLRYMEATDAANELPPVVIDFTDWRFFATARISFHDRHGTEQRSLRFVGACGMIWKELH